MASNNFYNYNNVPVDQSGQLSNYSHVQFPSSNNTPQTYSYSQAFYGYPVANQQDVGRRSQSSQEGQSESREAAVALSSLGASANSRSENTSAGGSDQSRNSWSYFNGTEGSGNPSNAAQDARFRAASTVQASQQRSTPGPANPQYSDYSQHANNMTGYNRPENIVAQSSGTSTSANWFQQSQSTHNTVQTGQSQQDPYDLNRNAVSQQQNDHVSSARRNDDTSSSHQSSRQARQNRSSITQADPAQNSRVYESSSRLPPIGTPEQYSNQSTPAPPLTVNPAEVYSYQAEQRRKAQADADRKREQEADRQRREKEREAHNKTILQSNPDVASAKSTEGELPQPPAIASAPPATESTEQRVKPAPTKAATSAVPKPQRKKASQSARKKSDVVDQQTTTTTQTASMGAEQATNGGEPSVAQAAPHDEEAEMRAMFAKMREFNSRNPEMLAKLWQEEREGHVASQTNGASAVPPPPPVSTPSNAKQVSEMRPFKKAKVSASTTEATVGPPEKSAKSTTVSRSEPATATQNSVPQSNPAVSASSVSSKGSTPPAQALWPPQKRSLLAELAAKWLTGLPQNSNKSLQVQEISKLLDTNPNYAQLCEYFENKGFRFERSAFARHLLQGIPESRASVPKPATPQPSAVELDLTSDVSEMHETQSHTASTSGQGASKAPITSSQLQLPASTASPSIAQSESTAHLKTKDDVGTVPYKRPADKEEAARKRTFGDLVDLTADLDSDDELAQDKRLPPVTSPFSQPPVLGNDGQNFTAKNDVSQQSLGQATPTFRQPQGGALPMTYANPSMPLTRPAMPQPVTEGNVKQNPQLQRQQLDRMRGVMLVEPIMRDRVARKSRYDSQTIARDVLLATGRHPDMRPLNSHLMTMEKLLGSHGGAYNSEGSQGNRSDLSTIRWQIIDPDPPEGTQSMKPTGPSNADNSTAIDEGVEADDEGATRRNQSSLDGQNAGTLRFVGIPAVPDQVVKKRRGRPRRVSPPSTTTTTREPANNGPTNNVTDPSAAPKVRKRRADHQTHDSAMASKDGASAAVGYAAFRAAEAPGVKRMGRPVGWRKAIHSKEAQQRGGGVPAVLPSRGGPKTVFANPKIQEAQYQVYRCRWLDCHAELHNLDTLKKHMVRIHGTKTDKGTWQCLWSGCLGRNEQGRIAVTTENGRTFEKMEDWMNHVDEQHIQKVAWKLGDGPRGGQPDRHQDTESEAYLSDAHGRSVTPVIQPFPQLPSRAVRKPHTTAEQAKAERELEAFRAHKQAIGVTMDRLGCILPNAKRRLGFMDDEDFEEIIEEDDPDD